MTFANIDTNDKNELIKRFFRLSWSTKRYHDIVKITGGYEGHIPSDLPYLHPSCFLYGEERGKMKVKDIAYDTVCIFFNTADPNTDIADLNFDPQLKKQLRDFKYEKVYDIYNSRLLFLAHRRNPKIVGAKKGGRIFIEGLNYIYYNPEYPLSFDENARIADLPFTLLASELIKITLFANSNSRVNMREMLDFAHLTTIYQNLQNMQKYSYLVLYEMISKLKHNHPFAEKITNRYISSYQLLRAKRNTYVKEPVYQDMRNFDFLVGEERKHKFMQEERDLSSLKGMIEELTGTSIQQMSSQEFEEMKSQENTSVFCNTYIHVEDKKELVDRLYYFDEYGKETLVDEATRFYPLGYEEKMFEFVHYVESIYNVATELAKKENKTLETSFHKIDYLKDKGYLSKEEAEKFKEYYLPLRNKLAHENIPFSHNDDESNHGSIGHLSSSERKLRNLTQVDFYREYKENIELELGGIYHRVEEELISPEEMNEILNKRLKMAEGLQKKSVCQQILGNSILDEELSKINFSGSSKHPIEISSSDGTKITIHIHSVETLDKNHEKFASDDLGLFSAPRTPMRISAQISSKKSNSNQRKQ